MIVIGLAGPKQAGKNTASQFIERWAAERGVHVVSRGFADLLKLSAYRIFKPHCTLAEAIEWADTFKFDGYGVFEIYEPTEGRLIDVERISGREFLQNFGTESHRDVFNNNFWVDYLLPLDDLLRLRSVTQFDTSNKYPQIACITDVRFQNEATRIKAIPGGIVARIDRPAPDTPQDTHASEVPLPHHLVDYVIDNSGNYEDYESAVRVFADANIAPRLGKDFA